MTPVLISFGLLILLVIVLIIMLVRAIEKANYRNSFPMARTVEDNNYLWSKRDEQSQRYIAELEKENEELTRDLSYAAEDITFYIAQNKNLKDELALAQERKFLEGAQKVYSLYGLNLKPSGDVFENNQKVLRWDNKQDTWVTINQR